MITNSQRKFLVDYYERRKEKPFKKRAKDVVYFHRIQAYIEKELEGLLWLCKNHRGIFLCEPQPWNFNQYGHPTKTAFGTRQAKERIRLLLMCVHLLMKNCEVELSLPELEREVTENE